MPSDKDGYVCHWRRTRPAENSDGRQHGSGLIVRALLPVFELRAARPLLLGPRRFPRRRARNTDCRCRHRVCCAGAGSRRSVAGWLQHISPVRPSGSGCWRWCCISTSTSPLIHSSASALPAHHFLFSQHYVSGAACIGGSHKVRKGDLVTSDSVPSTGPAWVDGLLSVCAPNPCGTACQTATIKT